MHYRGQGGGAPMCKAAKLQIVIVFQKEMAECRLAITTSTPSFLQLRENKKLF
jgi:hypothetical protein